MSTREKISSFIGDEALFLDPDVYDDAIIGVASVAGSIDVVAYDRSQCIEIIMSLDGCSREDAEEYFEYNVAGAYTGDGTPVFVDTRYAE